VQTLFVLGLATDYCVKHTVLDGCTHGFRVVLLTDATKGVNRQPDDFQKALQEMADAGAFLANIGDIEMTPSAL
jgi:nicotinamidase/pyrazinamidase